MTADTEQGSYVQLGVTLAEYAAAATLLYGDAAAYAYAEFDRHNREHFANTIPPLPIVFGLTAYGRCLGLTRHPGEWRTHPRITISTPLVNNGGEHAVSDVLLHELVHAHLMLTGQATGPSHGDAWCRVITRLSPTVLGCEITAAYVKPRRVANPAHDTDPTAPKTLVKREPLPGALPQQVISTWPQSLRPADYGPGEPLHIDTY